MSPADFVDQIGLGLRTAGVGRWSSGLGAAVATALLVVVTTVANTQATEAANTFDRYEATTVSIRPTTQAEANHLVGAYVERRADLVALPGVVGAGMSWVDTQEASVARGDRLGETMVIRAADVPFVAAVEASVDGHLPPDGRGLLVGIAADLEVGVGSYLTVDGRPSEVSGIVVDEGRASGLYDSVTRIASAEQARPADPVVVLAVEAGTAEAVALQAAALLGSGDPDGLQLTYRPGVEGLATRVLASVSALTLASTGGMMLIGGFMIGTSQYVTVLGRARELGWLKTLGASSGSLAAATAVEAAFLGFVAGGVGIVAALAGLLVAATVGGFAPVIDPLLLGLAAPAAGLVSLLGGLAPAIWVARLDPADAISAS